MALFKILKGNSDRLNGQNIVNGYCYVTLDEQKMYIDHQDETTGKKTRFCLNASHADEAGLSTFTLGGNYNIDFTNKTPKQCYDLSSSQTSYYDILYGHMYFTSGELASMPDDMIITPCETHIIKANGYNSLQIYQTIKYYLPDVTGATGWNLQDGYIEYWRTNASDINWNGWEIGTAPMQQAGDSKTPIYINGDGKPVACNLDLPIDWFKKGVSLTSGADLNTYKTPGKYYCNSEADSANLINSPVSNSNFVLFVLARTSSNTTSLTQLLITLSNQIWLRNCSSNGVWRTWYNPADQVNTHSLGEDGTGIDLDTLYQSVYKFYRLSSNASHTNLPSGLSATSSVGVQSYPISSSRYGQDISVNNKKYFRTSNSGAETWKDWQVVCSTTAGTAVGSSKQPVYITADGVPTALSYTIESNVPTNAKFTDTTYDLVNSNTNGLMTAADKIKLDSISENADAVSFTQSLTSGTVVGTLNINGTSTTLYAPTNTNTHYKATLHAAASGATANADTDTANPYLILRENGTTRSELQLQGSGATSISAKNGIITINSTDTEYGVATDTVDGLMSAADKAKLNGIAANATANKGDITGVTAGNGLTGGATSGTATLNVGAGAGISVTANAVALATIDGLVTTETYGPSSNVSGSNGATMNVPSITIDEYGRVTSIANKTYTAVDTDQNVKQTLTSSNATYPLLLAPSGTTATKTAGAYFDSGVTLNPSTNTIAANISGNAATADKWKTARNISISDSDGTNTGTAVSVDGSAAVTLTLPSTIKATLSGNASTATKLKTSRTIQVNLASTSSASFNGSANITPGVTGTLPIANGGTGLTALVTPTVTWTAGTSSGPKVAIKDSLGQSATAKAIPSASSSASGIVTTGTQTFAGAKTFNSHINSYGTIRSYNSSQLGAEIWTDTEGGNITIYPPSSTGVQSWNIDSYNGDLRFFCYINGTAKIGPHIKSSNLGIYGAVWNDYAEYRNQKEIIEPGYCVASTNNGQVYKTTEKFQACDGIVSDTFGFAIGETDECTTPLAVAGRVLAYFHGNRKDYHAGDTVCAGPEGKVMKMTREEIKEYPDRIIGIVSEIPEYETWGSGNVEVNNRIWIKVK